ncbi:hypothetical protein NM688_g9133 [Phlebia brevispora]|uniref:Uncharacterized protein n=1 Tax=Phlebia brevispora TaxID=194682 RepID=A0ACC1RLN0_9APHY|nr:hypothetical protein NM688_g9133 [Phlebia brevispora]
MNPDDHKNLPFPAPPPTQGLSTKTFRQPPMDGTLTGPEIYDWHMKYSVDHPLFVFADEQGNTRTINWPEAVRAVHRSGRIMQSLAKSIPVARPTFAIHAASDTITYFTTIVGIMRAGYIVFPISPRNSAAAVAHLISRTSTSHALVGSEPALQELAAGALKILVDSEKAQPGMSNIPVFEDIFIDDHEETFEPLPPYKPGWDDPALIMHSSGSTDFPKPIVWSHYRYLLAGYVPFLGEQDLCGQRLACHSMPMYHGMGLMQTLWTGCAGLVITAFKPHVPAIAPTPELVITGSVTTQSDIVFCVPSFVEAWAKNPEHVRLLQQTRGVLYGGGPLSQTVGDELIEKGIPIYILYGCSECGIISPVLPMKSGKDWNYFKIPSGIEKRFLPDANGNAELLILASPGKYMIPNILNTTIEGHAAYATSDLLAPHPTKPDYWKVFGRTDDQIMHNTGEKTNPAPLENMLNQDPHVRAAVMFGRGKFNAGVLIDPRPGFEFDPADEAKLVDFRNKIWPTVERLNEFAPQHSRLFKEVSPLTPPSFPPRPSR